MQRANNTDEVLLKQKHKNRALKTLKCYWQYVKKNWQFLHQLATILGAASGII